jgi:hypothetical protein
MKMPGFDFLSSTWMDIDHSKFIRSIFRILLILHSRESMTGIWRPWLPESIDGKPLATEVSELFLAFPYDRLPRHVPNNTRTNIVVEALMRPEVVVGAIFFYWSSKPLIQSVRDATHLNPKSRTVRGCIAVHNLALAIFSAVCAYNSWPIVLQHLWQRGFMATYCDPDGTLWNAAGFGAWSTIFYISKYYEFLDTWILVLKGKEASFLQVYHHSGIVLAMWGGVASQSAWLLFVVLLNSVIHTLMYTYFFIKTIWPKVEIKAARYLTMAQIGQFLTGITCSLGVLLMGNQCDTASSRFSLAFLHVYGFGLIALFVAFANRKYKKS